MKKINIFLYNILLLFIPWFLIEIIFKLVSIINLLNISTIRIIFSTLFLSIVIGYIELFLKEKTKKKLNITVILIITIYSILQVGLNNFIGVYISLNVSSQTGAVISYIFEFLKSLHWYYYFLIIPFILLLVYYKLLDKKIIKLNINKDIVPVKQSIQGISFLLVTGFLFYLTIELPVFQNELQITSNKDLFNYPTNPGITIKQFGPTVYSLLDIKSIFVKNNEVKKIEYTYKQNKKSIDDTEWINLINNEEDIMLNELNQYFINNNIEDKNSYTGLFEDKNLIVIMMESVNDIFINKDLYPNFYKLLSNGFYFKNHYSPRNSCSTGNNELSGMIGLYSIYSECTANTYSDNVYPESLFNLFNEKGYKTTSMHNYTEQYYTRRKIHTNLGSQRYYDVDDLKLTYKTKEEEWSSDEEFMKQVVKILSNYNNDERFMTWLTTVTSHQPYGDSLYGNMYLDLFKDKKYDNYDIKLKRYMSKLKVLDNGLGILIDGLNKQGKLNDTVIVLYGDHYPYGLSTNLLEPALPYSLEEKYEAERVPFVIWSNDIEATTFSEYTSYVNITPTLANLFNLNFDSRYYIGSDLFSNDYNSITVFADSSWKNKDAFYDASTSTITYYGDKEYSKEDILKINDLVEKKIYYSSLAIRFNYFNYLNEKLKK